MLAHTVAPARGMAALLPCGGPVSILLWSLKMRPVSFVACATAAVLCAAPLSAQQGHTALHTTVEQRDLKRLQARLASPEGLRLLEVRDAQGRTAPIPAADR
jgi:hypothetical protein